MDFSSSIFKTISSAENFKGLIENKCYLQIPEACELPFLYKMTILTPTEYFELMCLSKM